MPKIDDAPWPAFPPDLMSIALVTATQAQGTVIMHEKMYESRLFFVDKLITMGAQIILCDPHRAVIVGPSRLSGQHVTSPDIRAGMALVLAALAAHTAPPRSAMWSRSIAVTSASTTNCAAWAHRLSGWRSSFGGTAEQGTGNGSRQISR